MTLLSRLGVDTALLALQFALVVLLAPRNVLLLVALFAVSVAGLLVRRDPLHWGAFLLGVLFGSASDALQVAAGVYTYADPDVWVLPCYMFAMWGQIFLLVRSLLATLEGFAGPVWTPFPADRRLAIHTALWALATTVVCLGYANPPAVAATCLMIAVAMAAFDRRPGDLALAVLAATLGPLAEAILVKSGIYTFSVPTLWDLPAWHPTYWMVSVLLLRRAAGQLEARWK